MTSSEIRNRFLQFFAARGHAVLPSASLVPENDPSVLFNTAGMQPLVPYLMGQKHPLGTRLASCQKCVRTGDIEEVGNHKNLTFFEMLGNWSLGDYFKSEAIGWSYEFLTSVEEGLGLDPSRLYVTVFEGDDDAPRDMEAVEIWKQYIPEHRIYFLPKKNNWWSPGDNGPCGPDTEMFYDVTPEGLGDMTHQQYVAADDDGRVVEIWNDVFMQYLSKDGAVVGKLDQRNVDTGSGLERITMIVQGKTNVYETELFAPIMDEIKKDNPLENLLEQEFRNKRLRVLSDHLKASMFLISDGIIPGGKERQYILRKLLRRTMTEYGIENKIYNIFSIIKNIYKDVYDLDVDLATSIYLNEFEAYSKNLEKARNYFNKHFSDYYVKQGGVIYTPGERLVTAEEVFYFETTLGTPKEIFNDFIEPYKNIFSFEEGFEEKLNKLHVKHQEVSKVGSEQKFKGGLGGSSDKIVRSHTAHHLLLAALRQVLGEHVHQRGSNITDERIRIDFSHDTKMTDEQKSKVEKLVNEWIAADLPMQQSQMPREEAEQIGAEMEFGIKYPDMVSVYYVGDNLDTAISKEFCGGPHIDHTGLIKEFTIAKEEASSAGVRRIKATIAD